MKAFLAAAVAFALTVAPAFDDTAFAATLASIQGTVRVNGGSGFKQVAGATEVAPGTAVVAAPGGSAVIIYSNNCRVMVVPGAAVVVSQVPPSCDQAGLVQDYSGYYFLGGATALGLGFGLWAAQGQNKPASP